MNRTKYPRTMNLPWSGSDSSDDVWWSDTSRFDGKEVVVTEKLDGECTTIYPDGHIHARSIDSKHHPSRSRVKALAAQIGHQIPEGYRICGENVTAYHSIFYTELPSIFMVFNIFEGDRCCSWNEVKEMCERLSLHTVPIIHEGVWDELVVKTIWTGAGAFPTFDSPSGTPCEAEGYVVRVKESFPIAEFQQKCAKYVRPHHVQTDQNWMTQQMVPNLVKSDG